MSGLYILMQTQFVENVFLGLKWHAQWLCSYRLLGSNYSWELCFVWLNCLLIVFKNVIIGNFRHLFAEIENKLQKSVIYVLFHIFVIFVLSWVIFFQPADWLSFLHAAEYNQQLCIYVLVYWYWYIVMYWFIDLEYIDIFLIYSDIFILKTHILIVRRRQKVDRILHFPHFLKWGLRDHRKCQQKVAIFDSCTNIQNFSVVLLCFLNCGPGEIRFNCI